MKVRWLPRRLAEGCLVHGWYAAFDAGFVPQRILSDDGCGTQRSALDGIVGPQASPANDTHGRMANQSRGEVL